MTSTTMTTAAMTRRASQPRTAPLPATPPTATSVQTDPFQQARQSFYRLVAVSAAAFAVTSAVALLAPTLPWTA